MSVETIWESVRQPFASEGISEGQVEIQNYCLHTGVIRILSTLGVEERQVGILDFYPILAVMRLHSHFSAVAEPEEVS